MTEGKRVQALLCQRERGYRYFCDRGKEGTGISVTEGTGIFVTEGKRVQEFLRMWEHVFLDRGT